MEKFKFIDLFAGVGGIRLGLEQAFGKDNTECVMSSEIDKFAIKTYEANFGKEKMIGDIKTFDEKSMEDFNMILAGFPCQPFSKAGKEKGFKDERGELFFDIIRIMKEKRPEVVLLENVKGLKNHDEGRTFKVIMEELNQLNYHVHYKILNSKNFGLPQNRERIFIVCFRDEVDFTFPEKYTAPVKLSSILEKFPDPKYTISDKLWEGTKRRKEENLKKGKGFGYRLFSGDTTAASTITARYGKDGSEILIEQKGKNPRKLTPEEAKRYQGFPSDFKLVCSDTQNYKQFGNSVSVPVIKSICEQIKISLEKFKINKAS